MTIAFKSKIRGLSDIHKFINYCGISRLDKRDIYIINDLSFQNLAVNSLYEDIKSLNLNQVIIYHNNVVKNIMEDVYKKLIKKYYNIDDVEVVETVEFLFEFENYIKMKQKPFATI